MPPHAVARLRSARLARSVKPFLARGGSRVPRCEGCRLPAGHCLCGHICAQHTDAGVCLLMGDIEPLKPSNTGWLIADVVRDTWAFGWSRTEVDPGLLQLLADPAWRPVVVFPSEYASPDRVVEAPIPSAGKRPLFVLLDGTWAEARKMFRKSPYLDRLPVLSLQPEQLSTYRLRRSTRDDHLCTSEVAATCLDLAGDVQAARLLSTHLDLYTQHYLQAKQQVAADPQAPLYQHWLDLAHAQPVPTTQDKTPCH